MDIFVARQPIFNRKKEVAAYELLFRDSMENIMPKSIDGDKATSSVLSRSFMNLGLDSVSSGKKVFINFTRNLLLKQIPTIFPASQTVVEVLENIEPTEDVINACVKLKKAGYIIALDDFIFDKGMQPFVDIADIIKVDFMDAGLETIKKEIKNLPENIELLAEKVETWEEYRTGLDLGFTYFQGYFFSKPEIIKGRDFPALDLTLIEIVSEINKDDPDPERIVSALQKDVSISYKLLSLMNSALFKRSVEIKSIRETLNYLGKDEFQRFISVLMMSNLAKGSTKELTVVSCVRARFCELIAKKTAMKTQEAFMTGLFSMIDAILGQPMSRILEMLPLSENIKKALIEKKGELFKLIAVVTLFEKGDFDRSEKVSDLLSLEFKELPLIYKEAVGWADVIGHV